MRGFAFKGLVLVFTLCMLAAGGAPVVAGEGGKALFDSKKCGSCHQTAQAPAKGIEDELAKKGPDLWYAGSKFKKEFLAGWLLDPRPIRLMDYNSLTKKNPGGHPRLDNKDAAGAADYLMTLKAPAVKAVGIKPGSSLKGRFLFQKKLGCYGCHELKTEAKTVGGLTGPALIGASKRLQPDWIYSFLSSPRDFIKHPAMPIYSGIIDDSEMRTLAEYVSGM